MTEKERESKKSVSGESEDSDANDSNSENSALTSENKNSRKVSKALKELLNNENMKFMSNFDPELSNREKRKLNRKYVTEGKKIGSVYDENGYLSGSDRDVCDCLVEDCPGCHFPCPKCRSCKCGLDCRVNRRWMYEIVENEGEVCDSHDDSTLKSSNCCAIHS